MVVGSVVVAITLTFVRVVSLAGLEPCAVVLVLSLSEWI